jgi:hypothetical protein
MAIVDETRSIRFGGANALFTWSGMLSGDSGRSVDYSDFADRSVQFVGTFGGASVSLQGSNDGENWHTLSDPFGAPITKTSASLSAVTEMTRYVRPLVSGGDGSTSISAILFTLGGGA